MPQSASITALATLHPFGLAYSSSWRTEGSRGNLDGCQDRGEQRSRLLPKKPLCRGRAVRTREEEVMYCGQTGPLSGTIKASQLVIPQREMDADQTVGTPHHLFLQDGAHA